MAIVLKANYSKKLGLPGYSSHQYSVTVKTEVTDPNQVAAENSRLYELLQSCVDSQIQKTGYLPASLANDPPPTSKGRNGDRRNHRSNNRPDAWVCSDKQKSLILDLVNRNNLDKNQVEQLAQERFGKTVQGLNKLEASGLIDELIAQTGGPNGFGNGPGGRNYHPSDPKAGVR